MKKLVVAVVIAFVSLNAKAQIIYTVAGNATYSYSGDGGQATAAGIEAAMSVAIDAAGNLYVADISNSRIRKINTAGIISTFAGTGTGGYSGDGGQATVAEIYGPSGLLVDDTGNVYISDGGNNRIRKVNTAGIISTIAGTGTSGFSGDGGQATAGELSGPHAVAFDASGNMYIVDQNNNRIRMVNTSGIISTVAGTGTYGYNGDGGQATAAEVNYPSWVCFDAVGNLYVGDSNNHRLRKVNTAGIISTVAGNGTGGYTGDGGQATAAELANAAGMIINGAGDIYIADAQNFVIRKVNTSGIISTVAGNGTWGYTGDGGLATAAELREPAGVVLDEAGNLYIADLSNGTLRVVASAPLTITATTNTICAGTTTTLTAMGATGYTWSPSASLSAATGSMVAASPNVTTTYTIVSALYGVPTDTSTITITVNNPTTTTVSLVGCSSVTVNATTYTATGTYTQNLTNAAGCDSVLTIHATVNPLPIVTVNSATICVGATATLTANSSTATSYSWNTSATTASIMATPTVTTNYTIMVTDANNCVNWVMDTVTANSLPTISVTVNTATVCAGTIDTLTASGTITSYTWNTNAITVSITSSPTVTSTYTVMGTDVNNCLNWAIATITVNALPVIISQSGNVKTCGDVGAIFTVSSAGNNTYQWYYGNTVAPFDSSAIYGGFTEINYTTDSMTIQHLITGAYNGYEVYCIVTNINNCSATSKADTISVHSFPTITLVASSPTACIGSTTTLTASGTSTTYSWSNAGATTSSIIASPTVTTNYTVTGTNADGCMNTDTLSIIVENCYAGINEIAVSNSQISLYPNPNNGSFTIKGSSETNDLLIINELGQVIETISLKQTANYEITLTGLDKGVYYLIGNLSNTQIKQRIVVIN